MAVPAGLLSGLMIGWTGLGWPVLYVMPDRDDDLTFVVRVLGGSKRGQWLIERIVGADLDGDGYRGRPPAGPALPPLRVEVVQDGGQREDWIDLPSILRNCPSWRKGCYPGGAYSAECLGWPRRGYTRGLSLSSCAMC